MTSVTPAREKSHQPAEPRQRWRICFSRAADPARRTHRELADQWMETLESASLPIARPAGRARPILAFALPMPAGMACERELADLTLARLTPAWTIRETVSDAAPEGVEIVQLADVWTGRPALAAAVRGAVYRASLEAGVDVTAVRRAAHDMLAAERLDRDRLKGGGRVRYDLRPLLGGVSIEDADPPRLRIEVAVRPDLGAGRPEEVLACIAEMGGPDLTGITLTRERLLVPD